MNKTSTINTSQFEDTEAVVDPQYGSIQISSFEKRLINTPEFQRLRGIKQLGFVNLVYPAAEHSRFVHSIGVCHQAKKLISQINDNFKREKRYKSWRKNGQYHIGTNEVTLEEVQITTVEKIIIAAAALLHDLPHSPFSHEIESPNSDPKNGIQSHDEFDENPVLFKYIFDTKHSKLAEIISIYNAQFWELLKEDKKWYSAIETAPQYSPISVNNDGFVDIKEGSMIFSKESHPLKQLPILGVMIFEIHLFDKVKQWVDIDNIKKEIDARVVKTNWHDDQPELHWQPIPGWFRPYRKDIVGNTICADLIDYIERDGKHTGIISSIDLKFLDRMTISRAVPQYEDKPILKIPWDKIPTYCEHIIFDVYDHKRGFIRESVITEILSCLQARYQLTERVYNHRVVEGARSMLQEIARLLCSNGVLSIEQLHTCNSKNPHMPISDDTFLEWVMDADARIKDSPEAVDSIKKAAKLAELLKQRRVYREAVIIDGIHGYISGTMGGPDSNCMALDNALLSADPAKAISRQEMLSQISGLLSNEYNKNGGQNLGDELLVTIGARTYGKKYKVPRVLIAKPYFNAAEEVQKLDVMPLFACQDPPHIKTQLDAMKIAYNSLWRVYLFVHPAFHWNKKEGQVNVYLDLHKKVEKRFLEFTNNETLIKWKNSIDFTQLLPTLPIDYVEFISDETKPKAIVKPVVIEKEILTDSQLRELLDDVFKKVPRDSENVNPLNSKEYELFITSVRNDVQLSRYIEIPAKRELLLKNDFVTLHTKRGSYIQNIIQKFKNTMQNDGNGDIFSQQ